ncbi:ATP-binding protein [Pseudomonas taiwanensis]|uniref:ATP-binding protein n=1 Tax=Pseudomonas taiwanensis TaxID=470150 RepID=UPI0015BA576D|nr:ATP-binding protein [Pseudomonas taiwanensis]
MDLAIFSCCYYYWLAVYFGFRRVSLFFINSLVSLYMDRFYNPYTPNSGAKPPDLVGREGLRDRFLVALKRVRIGRSAKGIVVVGLRGVGKTTLLNQLRDDAEASNALIVYVKAHAQLSLPALLTPGLQTVLLRLERVESAQAAASRGLRGLTGFVRALNGRYGDIPVSGCYQPEPGFADNGDLEGDLTEVFAQVGSAAQLAKASVVILVDDLHRLDERQLAALIAAMHRSAQGALPILLVGAGYPNLRGKASGLKPYTERLFEYAELGPLDPEHARTALVKPAQDNGVVVDEAAADLVLDLAKGYPFFIQQWGKCLWDTAPRNQFTVDVVQFAMPRVMAALDQNFFAVGTDRLSLAERRYLWAMAELGTGPHHAIEISRSLGMPCEAVDFVRRSLIDQELLWSSDDAGTSFAAPLFDQFIRRFMDKQP